MAKDRTLWTPSLILLNLQFMLVTCVTALFFPFHAYLGQLGFSQEAAGFIIGADALASLCIQPMVSLLIHPGSARRWLLGGSLAFALALYLEGQFTSFAPLLAARLLQGAGFSCVISALISMIVDSIPPGMSGQAFGWTSLVRLIPYAAVPPLLEFFGALPAAFGQVLPWAALLALAPLGMLFFFRQRTAVPVSVPPGMAGALASLRNPAVALLLLASLTLYAGYAAVFFFLQELGTSLGIANSGMFFTLATLTMILSRLFGGPLFDRVDKVHLSTAGFVIIALAYALLPLAIRPLLFFALALCVGLGWGIVMPLQSALMFDLSPLAARGLNQNLLLVMMQAGFFVGPALAGLLLSAAGFTGLFVGAALATVVATLATGALRFCSHPRQPLAESN
jgi:predicted MFS family arabinose efflux permease